MCFKKSLWLFDRKTFEWVTWPDSHVDLCRLLNCKTFYFEGFIVDKTIWVNYFLAESRKRCKKFVIVFLEILFFYEMPFWLIDYFILRISVESVSKSFLVWKVERGFELVKVTFFQSYFENEHVHLHESKNKTSGGLVEI